MKASYPLISCICITNNRTILLQKAITCFELQNYPNKELVISYPKKDRQTRALVNNLLLTADSKILVIERSDEESVGNARNQAIAKCTGDYICIWDDDDWYHESRLTYQYNAMVTSGHGYHASVLTRVFLYDSTTQIAYLSFPYTWDGSILCRKEIILQNPYAHRDKGEDTHIIKFLDARKLLFHIDEAPFLYIYVFHGGNTWNYEHFEYFVNKSYRLNEETTAKVIKSLGLSTVQ